MKKPVYTIKECNEIRIYEDYAVLVLSYEGTEIEYTIDTEDVDKVKDYKWYYQKDYDYCRCRTTGVPILSRFVMNLHTGDKSVLEHIDGNKFNCRKSNLIVKDSNNYKSTISAPVIETEPVKEERSYSHIKQISNGYLINIELEQEPYTAFFSTKEEAIKAYDGIVVEIYRRLDPLNLYK